MHTFETLRIKQEGKVGCKPRFLIDTDNVINLESEFREKKLCDGPTFTPGHLCAFSCTFCYVPGMWWGNQRVKCIQKEKKLKAQDFVVEIAEAPSKVRRFLTNGAGEPKFGDPSDTRVIYGSPLVDIAGSSAQVNRTTEICRAILELTHWQIRLLSKSSLIVQIAKGIPEQYKSRVIFGVSTGTLDPRLAKSFERLAPSVTKRIDALRWLQDNGFRTFGMLCPILPQNDYRAYARTAAEALRLKSPDSNKFRGCEQVWAEVLNPRGESLPATSTALHEAGYKSEAQLVDEVASDGRAWQAYARDTFTALAEEFPPEKLRFLQYVDEPNCAWWAARQQVGAVLLGQFAKPSGPSALGNLEVVSPLDESERKSFERCEQVIMQGAFEVGLALREIRDRKLYREVAPTFEQYCRIRFELKRAHAYRQIQQACVVEDLKKLSPNGDIPLPTNEAQARELALVPSEKRLEVLKLAGSKAESVTARKIREARIELLGPPATAATKRKSSERFSLNVEFFRGWVRALRMHLEGNQRNEALKILARAEKDGRLYEP